MDNDLRYLRFTFHFRKDCTTSFSEYVGKKARKKRIIACRYRKYVYLCNRVLGKDPRGKEVWVSG